MGQTLHDYSKLLLAASTIAPLAAWALLLVHVLRPRRASDKAAASDGKLVRRGIALFVAPFFVAVISGLLLLVPFLIAPDGSLSVYWPSDKVFESAVLEFVWVFAALASTAGLIAVRVLAGQLARVTGSARTGGASAEGWSQAGSVVPMVWLGLTSPVILSCLIALPGFITGGVGLV